MRWWLACLATVGCADPVLRVEPAAIDLAVDLAQAAPSVRLQIFADDREVTGEATFELTGTPVGTLEGPQLRSDARTGGEASIAVTVDGAVVAVPVTSTIRGRRLVGATPTDAPARLAGPEVAVAQPLEPGDGAVLPVGLGALEVDFGADDADDLHEIAITAPYLDLHVYALHAPGPRQVALQDLEWRAIGSTVRGGVFTLAARSTRSAGGAEVHTTSASVEVVDVAASSLVFGAINVDAAGAPLDKPQLYRYDMPRAGVEHFASVPADGTGCIGCHVEVSPDGKRLVAGGQATANGGPIVGMLFDVPSRSLAMVDAVTPWNSGTFDPSGALLTSLTATGELTLRDGTTGAARSILTLGEPAAAPAISPDGKSLAYVLMEAPEANNPAGNALRVRPWSAATGTVGPPVTLVGEPGVLAPQFSSDGAWILYTRSNEPNERAIVGGAIVRADGSAPAIALSPTGAGDQIPRWASPITNDGAEPMAWIAFASARPIGATVLPGATKSLWLAAFYPARGVLSRPIHLPGQARTLFALHSPFALP